MKRPDFEHRLAQALKAAAGRPYDARTWNCARFAQTCVQAVSGRELTLRWLGSLESSADALFQRVTLRQAMRGDVVLANLPEPCVGVCLGRVAAFVGPSGLHREPMRRVVAAWSV